MLLYIVEIAFISIMLFGLALNLCVYAYCTYQIYLIDKEQGQKNIRALNLLIENQTLKNL